MSHFHQPEPTQPTGALPDQLWREDADSFENRDLQRVDRVGVFGNAFQLAGVSNVMLSWGVGSPLLGLYSALARFTPNTIAWLVWPLLSALMEHFLRPPFAQNTVRFLFFARHILEQTAKFHHLPTRQRTAISRWLSHAHRALTQTLETEPPMQDAVYSNPSHPNQDDTQENLLKTRFTVQLDRCIHLALEATQDAFANHSHHQLLLDVENLLDNGRVFQALHLLKQLPREDQRHTFVQCLTALVLWRLEDEPGVESLLKACIQANENQPLLLQDLVLCLQRFRQIESESVPGEIEELIDLVDTCIQTTQYRLAATFYEKLINHLPNHGDGLAYLGHLYCQAGLFEDATRSYHQAINMNPQDAIAHNNLGVLYMEYQQQPERARPLLEKAIQLKTNYTMAMFNLGRCLKQLNERQEAAEWLLKAKESNLSHPEVSERLIDDNLRKLFMLD